MKSVGRKQKYGEPTVPMRIPESMVPLVEELLAKREVLNTQYEESLLPPVAEKLVKRIHTYIYEFYQDNVESQKQLLKYLFDACLESGSIKESDIPKHEERLKQYDLLLKQFGERNPRLVRAYLSASIAPDEGSSEIGLPADFDLLEKKI